MRNQDITFDSPNKLDPNGDSKWNRDTREGREPHSSALENSISPTDPAISKAMKSS